MITAIAAIPERDVTRRISPSRYRKNEDPFFSSEILLPVATVSFYRQIWGAKVLLDEIYHVSYSYEICLAISSLQFISVTACLNGQATVVKGSTQS
jgi:hypothetical protein